MKILTYSSLFFILFIFSCSGGGELSTENVTPADKLDFSIFFYIHGDGDYLYHNQNNEPVKADEETLQKAISTAENLTNAEVFIFHQKQKKNFLLFFRKNDRDFYYFRGGKLIDKRSSKTQNEDSFPDEEISFIENFSAAKVNSGLNSLFLYFGHQLPENENEVYGDSFPELKINTKTLSKGLEKISHILNKKKFDVTVLSTCLSGTPITAVDFLNSTRFVIASPEDLHLSYMNIDYLRNLGNVQNFDAEEFSVSFAENSFEELKKKTTTIITTVVYDVEKLKTKLTNLNKKNLSCEEMIDSLENEEGVTVFFRAPKFGKRQNEKEHTGWNCAD